MLCDAVREEEIFEAYLLYASLHGLSTAEDEIRQRITSYLNNVPDAIIDDAILAFAEDRIVAPPDVVLERWGKSRIYELIETPQRDWRHQVSESWFDNDCEFHGDQRDPVIYHFWTNVVQTRPHKETQPSTELQLDAFPPCLPIGTRLQLHLDGTVKVLHRHLGEIGALHASLSEELKNRINSNLRYLALVDSINEQEALRTYKLLVTVARDEVGVDEMVSYAARAYSAVRLKC